MLSPAGAPAFAGVTVVRRDREPYQTLMRPDILNPLFAEVEVLKGIGPALAKPLKRLGLDRVVDILFHLPVNWIERKRVDVLDMADAGGIVTVLVTPVDYRQGGARSPFRVHATDREGNYL